jgi:hypothetical protein
MKKRKIKNEKTINILSNQKGMALLTTLIFVFILVTFAVALLTMTSNDTKLSTLQRESTRAFYIAETGIDKALWYLNTPVDQEGYGLNWRTNVTVPPVPPGPLTDGTTSEYYGVTVLSDPVGQTDTIRITSTGTVKEGKYSAGKRKIEVMAKKSVAQSSSVAYNYALFAETIITLIGDLTVVGDIHSNGIIDGSENIQDITGEITTGGNQLFPVIDFGYYKGLAVKNGTYYGEDDALPSEFVDGGTISGIYFIDDDIDILGNTILTVHNGAIFSSKSIYLGGNAQIIHIKDETYNNPLALVAKGDIDLMGTISTQGVIQSNSTVTIGGTDSVLNAAVVADTIRVNGTPAIIYDPNLQGTIVPGAGIEIYKKISWQETY